MKITESKLREIIKEEYLRAVPVAPGALMSEARADYLAEQVLEEGLWDNIKAGFAGLKAGGSKAAEKMGGAASKALTPAVQAVKSVASSAVKAAGQVSDAIGKIKDESLKSAALAAQKSFQDSLKSSVQSSLSAGIKQLVSAGMSEDEAKSFASSILTSELMKIAGLG